MIQEREGGGRKLTPMLRVRVSARALAYTADSSTGNSSAEMGLMLSTEVSDLSSQLFIEGICRVTEWVVVYDLIEKSKIYERTLRMSMEYRKLMFAMAYQFSSKKSSFYFIW